MTFLSHLINGISLGSVYAIIALGYTMVYGIAKMLNFAHGDVIMVGAYISFCTTSYLGLSPLVSVLFSIIVCTVLGIVVERLAYKPLRQAPSLAVLITAIGVSYFLQNAALLIWGSSPKTFSSVTGSWTLKLFDGQLIVSGVTIVTILACILIGILSIGVVLMLLMNRMITVPVSRLQTRMVRIAGGDFSRDPSVEWDHELGDIGRGINDLSENVSELMEKRLEDEKQKQDLEYKMLQSQINPHFLYNTLNSIKWMATIQGATGISEMTTSLSRLLKSISKGTSLLIDIREELSLLENYFTIQSYRYGGTITMDIQVDNESLYNSEIIKFTLQPLVENAIFHGIEPKGCAGHIRIHVGYETSDNTEKIRIDVTDDGVGMTADKAAQVLRSNDDSSADFFREIGVSNVHKRLQYQFGAEYGITIESKEGEYTTMSIHIPNIPLHNNETVSSETISSENT